MNTAQNDMIAELDAQEEFENPTAYEAMIGKALLGDDKEKTRQMIRVDCKMYASTKMFCECAKAALLKFIGVRTGEQS